MLNFLRKYSVVCFLLLGTISAYSQKKYHKAYYDNGVLKEEGWLLHGEKTAYWKFYYNSGKKQKEGWYLANNPVKYWYFYHENGRKEKEGHFVNGKKNKWWLFYDVKGRVNHKCQLKNNKKNGYCLRYHRNKLIKAEKYKNGKKIKEWTDFSSFRKENDLKDLK